MGALKWIRAVVAMAAFVSTGYVTACAGGGDNGGGEERVGEAQEAIGEACTLNLSTGQYSCTGGFLAYQRVTCCVEGTDHVCRDTYNDWYNCGSCGYSCSGSQWCRGGTCCGVNKGLVHLGDCDHNGTCEKTLNTNTDCGYCGRACSGGQTCVNYNCQCPSGQTYCSGTCTDLQNDDLNCGGCGNKCQGGKHCQSGTCQCPSGQTDCSGTCKNLQNDPSHCGSCTNACSVAHGTAGCSGGICTVASCNTPYANCDGQYSNGCEANSSTDAANCGGCGYHCFGSNACNSGACECTGFDNQCSYLGTGGRCCGTTCVDTNTNCHCGGCGSIGTGNICCRRALGQLQPYFYGPESSGNTCSGSDIHCACDPNQGGLGCVNAWGPGDGACEGVCNE